MTDQLIADLAAKCGIATSWTDFTGTERHVSIGTLRAILSALGLETGSDVAIRNSLSVVESSAAIGQASTFVTSRVGLPVSLPIPVPESGSVEVTLDGGSTRVLSVESGFDGRATLPPIDQPGYHAVRVGDAVFTVATAPSRCISFADLSGGATGWGVAAQVYSLRANGDGGIGGFAGVGALAASAARLGADVLTISPVHALFGSEPNHFSPYSPSTRLFYNPLHADPAATFPAALIQQAIDEVALDEEMKRLEGLALIDWPAATRTRHALLRALFAKLRGNDPSLETVRAEFQSVAADPQPMQRGHAVFEALHAARLREAPNEWHWRDWPAGLRDPDSAEVIAFAQAHEDEIAYQIFLQWLTGRSYGEAQRICRESGMRVGLVADLAIGMDGAGSHAWNRQKEVLTGLGVGAPPDYYNERGQNWGLTAFSPRGLAASGFAPFIETLRANLRFAGGIRIDHVMGMSRLWVVPDGAEATEGAYLSFPSETLFRLTALESHRHKAIVIGEDLGTLPMGFKDYLHEQGIAGMRVLRFEKTDNGHIPPREWDPATIGMTSTHDMAPTAGWWRGSDLEDPADPDAWSIREWHRGQLWGGLEAEGLVEGPRPGSDEPTPIVDAVIRYVAASPCELKIIPLEDALALETRPNVPGTTIEKPNWRHRLEDDAGALLEKDAVRDRLRALGPPRVEND
jgi:4-alpha-glucanotransferase